LSLRATSRISTDMDSNPFDRRCFSHCIICVSLGRVFKNSVQPPSCRYRSRCATRWTATEHGNNQVLSQWVFTPLWLHQMKGCDISVCRYKDDAHVLYRKNSANTYRQYLHTKATAPLFCAECSTPPSLLNSKRPELWLEFLNFDHYVISSQTW